jgi:predicted MFS family arabinose efflux permease
MSGRWSVLLLLFGVNLLNYVDRQILYAVFPLLQHDLSLTDTQLGLLASAFMWVYLMAAPAFGYLGDCRSRPRLMGVGVALWSAATTASGMVGTYAHLLVTRTAVGIGEASYGAVAPALISDHFTSGERSRALAVFSMAIPAGSALGYLLGGWLGTSLGWRSAFFVVGVHGLLLAWRVGRQVDPPRGGMEGGSGSGTESSGSRRRILELLRTPSYVLNCLAMTAMTFVIGGLAAWMPTYLVRVRGMELGPANLTFGLLTLVSGVGGTIAGGWLGDRMLRRVPAAYFLISGTGLLLSVPCAAAVILAGSRTWALAAIFLAEVLIFLNTGPLNAVIAGTSRPGIRASAYALNIFIIHALGDAVSPAVVGALSDRVGLAAALWIAPAGLGLAAALCFWGARYYAADAARLRN